jgi:hypothetical protein
MKTNNCDLLPTQDILDENINAGNGIVISCFWTKIYDRKEEMPRPRKKILIPLTFVGHLQMPIII